jgi:hypothetical protein
MVDVEDFDPRQAYLGKRISRAQNGANSTRKALNTPAAVRVAHSAWAPGAAGERSKLPANPGNTTGLSQPSALTDDTPK